MALTVTMRWISGEEPQIGKAGLVEISNKEV
jgi:hypothetical protein